MLLPPQLSSTRAQVRPPPIPRSFFALRAVPSAHALTMPAVSLATL